MATPDFNYIATMEALDMTSVPLVSIVTPMYNAAGYIEQTIQSALNQTYRYFEIILVDDCSSDDTRNIVEAIDDRRVKMICNAENIGAGKSRNAAVRAARGRYIAFLDADDLWTPDKLEVQVAYMEKKNIAFIYTGYDVINDKGEVFSDSGKLPKTASYHQILRHNWIRTSSAIYDTERTGGKIYFSDIRKRQDMIMFLDIIKKTGPAHLLDQVTCSYRVHSDSISSSKMTVIPYQWAAYRKVEGLSLFYSSYLMGYWFCRAGFKTLLRRMQKTLK